MRSAWTVSRPAAVALTALAALTACESNKGRILDSEQSQVQLRQVQTRAFDTSDSSKTLRTVIATLQDLGFVIDKADAELGAVSATKLDRFELRMTVTVRPRGEKQLLVRANAQYELTPVADAEFYQQFFAALEKAMFLAAQQVE
jgi:hypothetical protein